MINDAISKIEAKILENEVLKEDKKKELIELVEALKKEIVSLSDNDKENAASIANFTSSSAHEAIKSDKNEELLAISLDGLATSVRKFEVTHPELTKAVNAVCNFLSNLGI